jgi:hypothetical protein
LHALRQYWERLLSRLKPGQRDRPPAAAPEDLEREISDISNESHVLAEAVQRVRSDFEHAREEESRKIVHLEEVRRAMQLAREEDRRKLAALESINDRYASDRETDHRKLGELEARLAGLEAERGRAREQVEELQGALTTAEHRLEQANAQIRDLQVNSVEQAREFKAALADASERLEATDTRVKLLGSRLETEHRQVLKTFEELRERFHRQDVRARWIMAAAGLVMLIGAMVGAALFWANQNNASLLADMSRDIKDLMAAVNSRQDARQSQPFQSPSPARPVQSPGTERTVTGVAAGKAAGPPVTSSTATTITRPATVNPYFLGSAFDRGRLTNREGVRQATRQDADKFFEENASVPGMVTLDSGVQYRVLKAGGGGSPEAGDTVVLSYVGTKLDGTVIDETYSGGTPATFGMDEVLPAWREVLLKMEEGSEFELYVPPNMASRGGVRNRGVTGFEPTLYLIELQQVIRKSTSDPSAPSG